MAGRRSQLPQAVGAVAMGPAFAGTILLMVPDLCAARIPESRLPERQAFALPASFCLKAAAAAYAADVIVSNLNPH
jgi:hypothetical protein